MAFLDESGWIGGDGLGRAHVDRQDAEERAALAKKYKTLQLNPDWYDNADQMMQDIAGRQAGAADDRKQAVQDRAISDQANRRQPQGGFATHPMQAQYNNFMQQFGPQAQGNALQGAIDQTMNAWQDENDSRVSQEREARRMEHEKEIERMRIEALMQRLSMESGQSNGPRPIASGRGFKIY